MSTEIRRTPEEWCEIKGMVVRDRAGWNGGRRSWTDPITESEFNDRAALSTTGPATPPAPEFLIMEERQIRWLDVSLQLQEHRSRTILYPGHHIEYQALHNGQWCTTSSGTVPPLWAEVKS